jgi:glucose/arabinose dehydrogenase
MKGWGVLPRRSRIRFVLVSWLVTLGWLAAFSLQTPVAQGATVPVNFQDQPVTTVADPTALAFTPDRRLLITSKGGALRIYKNGALLPTPALDLSSKVCMDGERGLLGVAVDPAFTTNHTIYLYYTFKKLGVCDSSAVNRVSRFILGNNNVVAPASEVVMIDNIPSTAGNHNGGDLQFGRDGFLYISVGDGGCDYLGDSGCGGDNDAARDQNVLIGKVLRVTRNGAIPSTNPFLGTDSARCNVAGRTDPGKKCRETYAWGLRNPFRIAFDGDNPGTRFFINDTGQSSWEEIDLGKAGADYGWNVREGHCATGSTTDCGPPPAGMTNPIYDYNRSAGCGAITGGAFVPNRYWPASYDNSYLYGDFVCLKIFKLTPNLSGGFSATEFATGTGGISGMIFGPNGPGQALYYLNFTANAVRRIAYVGPTCHGLAATGGPTSGNDVIVGTAANDSINGGGGNDTICGGNGSDTLRGGSGNDELYGDAGNDSLGGDDGSDVLDGGNGADSIAGGVGIDTATYVTRTTGVTVDIDGVADDGNSNDGPVGARDNVMTSVENLTGGAGADTLIGGGVGNRLIGGTGADILRGLNGNDALFANDGIADQVINCDGGTSPGTADSAHVDAGDPAPSGCESVSS